MARRRDYIRLIMLLLQLLLYHYHEAIHLTSFPEAQYTLSNNPVKMGAILKAYATSKKNLISCGRIELSSPLDSRPSCVCCVVHLNDSLALLYSFSTSMTAAECPFDERVEICNQWLAVYCLWCSCGIYWMSKLLLRCLTREISSKQKIVRKKLNWNDVVDE